MRQIAADSSLNLPSIYHFYANKAALHAACRDEVFRRLAVALDQAFTTPRRSRSCELGFVTVLRSQLAHDERVLPFLESRETPLVTQTPLHKSFERFAELLMSSRGMSSATAKRVTRLVLGMAIGCEIAARRFDPCRTTTATLRADARVIHNAVFATSQ